MLIEIKNGQDWYKNYEGQKFAVERIFDFIHKDEYIVSDEDNKESKYIFKKDCKIVDEEYNKAIDTLNLQKQLDYYTELKNSLQKDYLKYSKENKKQLANGSLINEQRVVGKIELLKDLIG